VLAAGAVPRVAVIVGPVGGLTSTYRGIANQAAAAAEAAGAQVVKVYSPNATWSAVRRATQGASIVVYLGHGNGWPSPYRDSLFPPTQNGFGLNPVAGVDDVAHQYFGEASVERLQLAANAVVVLSHLCYASGNSEPGLPEGDQATAIARVDNFAAGFIRAGARAVVAEAHETPAYYVRALLRGHQDIEQIWQRSPSANGNLIRVASTRSPGFTERLDPDHPSGGYYRSLVSQGVTAADLRAGATGHIGGVVAALPAVPSLASLKVRFGNLSVTGLPIAATSTGLTLPVSGQDASKIPDGAMVSVRWDPILLDPPAASADPGPSADPAVSDPGASPAPSASPVPSDGPVATPAASSPADPAAPADPGTDPTAPPEPPEVALIAPEQPGTVVTASAVKHTAKGLRLEVTYPAEPGLYRLEATLHAPSGVAYDAATQALLTPALVRVGGPLAVAYGAPATLSLSAGASSSVAVRVVNAGSEAWDGPSSEPPSAGQADDLLYWLLTSNAPAHLVASWVSGADSPVPDPVSSVLDPAVAAPGGNATVTFDLVAPTVPGDYLLLLDVVSPVHGSLSVHGTAPAIIRVTVSEAAPTNITPGSSSAPLPAASGGTLDPASATPLAPASTAPEPSPAPLPSPSNR
jgi:hypothetical protein